jgi:hypothetical protein
MLASEEIYKDVTDSMEAFLSAQVETGKMHFSESI